MIVVLLILLVVHLNIYNVILLHFDYVAIVIDLIMIVLLYLGGLTKCLRSQTNSLKNLILVMVRGVLTKLVDL